jgi:hypothetical protein
MWTHPKTKPTQTDACNQETSIIAHNTPRALTTSAIRREALASKRAYNSGKKTGSAEKMQWAGFEPMLVFA